MAPLGALSQAWVSAEASLPLGWLVDGLGTTVAEVHAWRIDGGWGVVKWEYCRG